MLLSRTAPIPSPSPPPITDDNPSHGAPPLPHRPDCMVVDDFHHLSLEIKPIIWCVSKDPAKCGHKLGRLAHCSGLPVLRWYSILEKGKGLFHVWATIHVLRGKEIGKASFLLSLCHFYEHFTWHGRSSCPPCYVIAFGPLTPLNTLSQSRSHTSYIHVYEFSVECTLSPLHRYSGFLKGKSNPLAAQCRRICCFGTENSTTQTQNSIIWELREGRQWCFDLVRRIWFGKRYT